MAEPTIDELIQKSAELLAKARSNKDYYIAIIKILVERQSRSTSWVQRERPPFRTGSPLPPPSQESGRTGADAPGGGNEFAWLARDPGEENVKE